MKKMFSILILICVLVSSISASVMAEDSNTNAMMEEAALENIKLIAHRGYAAVAPENTESAFRLAKEKGFEYVETDVKFTKDGVAVLIHDASVDRTSNGTGNIADLTLAEVKALDFGSWKSEDYAGEQILTFEEFIILCKNLGLHPYIEMGGNCWNEGRVAGLISTIEDCGMTGNVTFLSQKTLMLGWVVNTDPNARLCYCITTAVTEDVIDTVKGWQTGSNTIVLDVDKVRITEEGAALCKANGIPLGVWTVDNMSYINSMPDYVSEVTTNVILPEDLVPSEDGNSSETSGSFEPDDSGYSDEQKTEKLKVFLLERLLNLEQYEDELSLGEYSFDSFTTSDVLYIELSGLPDFELYYNPANQDYTATIITNTLNNIRDKSPKTFWCKNQYVFFYNQNDYKLTKLGIRLDCDKDFNIDDGLQPVINQVNSLTVEFDSYVQAIVDLIPDSYSDYEKVLFINDYLCTNYKYDTRYHTHNAAKLHISNAYDFFKEGTGVCQAYTLAFMAIMDELGIRCDSVASEEMNHIWNLVELNDKWYHVDVTWNDPCANIYDTDTLGKATHEYFLLSTEEIQNKEKPHYDFDVENLGYEFGTEFDDVEIDLSKSLKSSFIELNGIWYNTGYNDANQTCGLYAFNSPDISTITNDDLKTPLYQMDTWNPSPIGYYASSFSYLAKYGNTILFNTPTSICVFDGNEVAELYIPEKEVDEKIYGFTVKDDKLLIQLATSADEDGMRNAIVKTANIVDVVYKNYDGTILAEGFAVEGEDAPDLFAPDTAVRNTSVYYDYTLDGWETENGLEYIAKYTKTLKEGANPPIQEGITVSPIPSELVYGDNGFKITVNTTMETPNLDSFEFSIVDAKGNIDENSKVATVDAEGNVTINAAGTTYIQISRDGGDNYADFKQIQTLVVAPKEILVTPTSGLSKYEGQEDTEFTYTFEEDKLVDAEKDVISGALARAEGEEPGVYNITLGTLKVNDNYKLVLPETTVTFEIIAKLNQDVTVSEIDNVNLCYGDTLTLSVTQTNPDVTNDFVFNSSNEEIATIDEDGKITFIGAGEVKITISNAGNYKYNEFKKEYNFVVAPKEILVTPTSGLSKYEGQDDVELTYTFEEDKLVDANKDVISGSLSRVEGETAGTYKINLGTLKINDNYKLVLPETAVTFEIKAKLNQDVSVSEIDNVNLCYGDTLTLSVTQTNPDVTNDFIFSSNNEAVATVDEDGKIVFVGVGEVKITISNAGNYKYNNYEKAFTFNVLKREITLSAFNFDKKTATFTNSLEADNTINLDFNKAIFEVMGICEEDNTKSKVKATNLVLTGEKAEYYTLTTEQFDCLVANTNVINVNPKAENGSISGVGKYLANVEVTLSATANSNYKFDGWYNNKTLISTNATHIFNTSELEGVEARFSAISISDGDESNDDFSGGGSGAGGGGGGSTATKPSTDADKTENTDKTENNKEENKESTEEITPVEWNNPFVDVDKNAWYFNDVKNIIEKKLMTGTADDTFSPNAATTRGMIVTILYRLEEEPVTDINNIFNDVNSSDYYSKAVAWAVANNIVNGVGDGKFAPNDEITREQFATILYRYAGFKGLDVVLKAELDNFSDNEEISNWATEAIAWSNANGIITGTSATTISPQNGAIRAQAAAMLNRFINLNNK